MTITPTLYIDREPSHFGQDVQEMLETCFNLVVDADAPHENVAALSVDNTAPDRPGLVIWMEEPGRATDCTRSLQPGWPIQVVRDVLNAAILDWRREHQTAWAVDHIAVAMPSIEPLRKLYTDVLGLVDAGEEVVEDQRVRTAFMVAARGGRIELLEPTDSESPISAFLERRGSGLHHICLTVPDIRDAIQRAKKANIRMIDEEPGIGSGGRLIAFIHPKSTGGVLIELSQEPHE